MASLNWVIVLLSAVTLGWAQDVPYGDPVVRALKESELLNYDELYDEALVRLDMENLENVTNQELLGNMNLEVGSGNESCNGTIRQMEGIPWAAGNSSMEFLTASSYVKVYGNPDPPSSWNGVSVSLWIKTPDGNQDYNCTVMDLDVGSRYFKLSRIGHVEPSDSTKYEFNEPESDLMEMSFNKSWEWNMISFTINENISIFANGAPADNNTISMESTTIHHINLTLNNNMDGCVGLEVDEVALWNRVLNMSEFIALRVQPFNISCPPEDVPDLEDLKSSVATAGISEASASLQMAKTEAFRSMDDLRVQDVIHLLEIVKAVSTRNLLNHPILSEKANLQNRKDFVAIGSVIFDKSRKDSEIKGQVDVVDMVRTFEDTLRDTYFTDFGSDENISSPFVDVTFRTLSVTDNEDIELGFETGKLAVTLPSSGLRDGLLHLLIIIYDEEISRLLVEENESERWLSTPVISIQLDYFATTFKEPIVMIFSLDDEELQQIKNDSATASCAYLNLTSSEWMEDGIEKIVDQTRGLVICQAFHLTNFAVLLSPADLKYNPILSTLSYILLGISMICLLVTFLVLMCLPEIANTQRVQILKNFICALFMAQVLFVFTSDLMNFSVPLCKLSAVLSHYFWVATFTWMLVQGIQLYTKVRRLVGGNIKQLFYVLFAWGFPFPVAVVPILMFRKDYDDRVTGSTALCWIPSKLIWFLAIPLMLIFCVNLGVTVLVMKTFLTVKVNKDKSNMEKLKSSMRAVIVMVPVLGLTWAFGFLLLLDQNEFFQYLFVILNCLQGVFVFLFHLVLNEDVRTAVLRRRNKVASNVENTIFTKVARNKNCEQSAGIPTVLTKAPFPSGDLDKSSSN